MSISIVSNFKYQGPLANFERDQYATLNDMLNVDESTLPSVFIGICLETKKAYLYDASNTVDPITGKWREIANGSDVNDATISVKKNGTLVNSFTTNDATAKDINITIAASDLSDVTATAAELNVLNGITSTTNELNQLHESNVTKADFEKLHSVTADASELNVLDGITATTTELNYVDGVTSNIQTQINDEVGRATGVEEELGTKIGTLNSLTTDAKTNLVSAINEVDSHADTANSSIGTLNSLTTDAKTTLVAAINEVDSHTDTNTSNIGTLNSLTTDEKTTLVGAINEIDSHCDTNTSSIGTLNSLTTDAKTTLVAAINEIDSHTDTNTSDISDINVLIPNEATEDNQLADKDFVNSSIATQTGNFIGTFPNIPARDAYTGEVTNNDYCFVINSVITDNGNDWASFTALNNYDKSKVTNFDYAWVIDGSKFDLYRFDVVNQVWEKKAEDVTKEEITLNNAYNRYKAIVTTEPASTTWEYEFTLNNSSFTAQQWAAINSGATTSNIGQITTNKNAIGTLNSLTTDAKTNLVSAINEIDSHTDTNTSSIGTLNSLTTDAKTNLVGAINEVDSHTDTNTSNIGTLNSLTTEAKTDLVAAINEVDSHADSASSSIGTLSSLTTDEKTTIVGAINEVDSHTDTNTTNIGTMTSLTTTEKTTLVGAINELDSGKVDANTAITGATHTKITYDSKGLVTAGADITLSDVTDITATASEVNVLDGITASTAELNILDGVTATASEINVLDGITATTTELNYVDGVTSAIQTQLDNKVDKVTENSKVYGTSATGEQTSYSLSSSATANTVAYRGDNGVLNVGTPTANSHATTKSYVDTEVGKKVTANTAITGATHTKITYDSKGLVTEGADITLSDVTDITASASEVNVLDGITASTSELNVLDGITATTTELNYVDGVTSSIQGQIGTLSSLATTEKGSLVGAINELNTDTETNASAIETINGKIPSAATSSNKLVDNKTYTDGIATKVDKTDAASKVYGTDDQGEQTTYDLDSFGKVDDVKIGESSLVSNKIATIPLAGASTVGVASFNSSNGVTVNANGAVSLVAATNEEIDAKTESKKPITPSNLAYAIEKGLGVNGLTWTDQEKSSARSTIGAQATITGAATTVTSNNLTASRVVISNSSGKIATSDITSTELGYLDNVTSNIQQQINDLNTNKVTKNDAITAGTATRITYDAKGLVTAGANNLTVSDITDLTASAAELNILDGATLTTTELNYVDGATANIQEQITTLSSELDAEIDARETMDETQGTYISNIQAVIPSGATSSNQLADKKYVNDLIQSTAADFRGSWDTYADVPTDPSLYPEDETGSHIPNTNDYIIIQRDETQDGGTWRYKYTGDWTTDGKSGWTAEYEINANPLTQDQIAALDSGITDTLVAQISTNEDNITALTNSKQNNITGAASSVTTNNLDPSVVLVSNSQGKIDDSSVSTTELGYLSGVTSNLQTQLNGKQANLNSTQLDAVNSGITEAKRQSYDNHIANTDIHVTTNDKINWNAKQEALNETQMAAVDSGITETLRESYDTHLADTDIHITAQERTTWNAKQNAINDLSDIRDGAAAGTTAVQNVTVNGTSIVSNKTAVIPLAAQSGDYGLVKLSAASYGISKDGTNNFLKINAASADDISAKTSAYKPIVPSNLDNAVKVGVTTNTNTLTDQEKSNAQSWLGVDTELAKKQNNITGAATTITSSDLTASRVLVSDANGKVAADANITTTELGYLDGVTSNIQTQFSNMDTAKANKATTLAGYGITNAYTKDEVDEKVAGVYIYKGSVATQADLPASGNRTGDVYNVESDGTNWAWNGTSWDNLGALIDLSVKQDVLVSGENIKTINNTSILGSGNLSLPTTVAGLDDTVISSAADKQFLVYESSSSKWKNKTVHIPADANNATISIKDSDATLIGDFTTDQSSAETITIPQATTSAFGLVKVDSALSDSSTNPVQNKVINTALSGKQANLNSDQLAAVNSGVTEAVVAQVGTNTGAITTINSSAVMNSGITSDLVTTYNTHVANTNIHVTSDQKTAWTNKQDALVSGTNIKTINNTSILGSGNIDTNPFPTQTGNSGKFLSTNGTTVSWESVDAFPTQTGNSGKVLKTDGSDVSWDVIGNSGDVIPFGTSSSAADATQKNVTISSITSLRTGQVIIIQPTVTSTVANSTIKLNSFDPYPMMYNGAAITTSTDAIVWTANVPSWWRFDGTNWVFLGHGLDSNTTYTINYSIDAGVYTCGTGAYPVTRYSLIAQKANGTWEKITATNASYSTSTSKSVNTNGFRLNQLRYHSAKTDYTTAGASIATNTVYEKAASVDLRYSTNCGATTSFAIGDYIYLVGTIGSDGLFYFSTSNWWTNTLPSTNDGKVYIRIGIALAANGYTCSFFEDRPIFYHNGTKICEYKVADNKQDLLVSGTNIKTIDGVSILGSGDIDIIPTQTGNSGKFLTTNGTTVSWGEIVEYTAAEVDTLWDSITPTAA